MLGQRINVMYLYKRRKNKAVDQFVKASRSRTGGVPVPTKKAGLRQLLIGLKRGDSLVILPDQKPSANKARIDSSFFGHSAPTTTLVQNLCSKLDCDVFVAVVDKAMHKDPEQRYRTMTELLGDLRVVSHLQDPSAIVTISDTGLSVRRMPWLRSSTSVTASGWDGSVKLGQPQPLSNLAVESKSFVPHPAQTNSPSRFSAFSSPVKARSVPACRRT